MSGPRRSSSSGLPIALAAAATLAGFTASPAASQTPARTLPVFQDGQAQIVPGFADSTQWVRQRLWVETEFDTDGDGKRDRMHVDVTRPGQTESEQLKVPVIYESSPYFAGTSSPRQFLWNVQQEVDAPPPPRTSQPEVEFRSDRAFISNSQVSTWVPRGFAVVHSESPGTGLSQGCPTVGGANESLAPKAVIDWLNGRAKGFTTANGNEEVRASWSTGKVGMTGTSYNGTLPVAAATTGVDGLEAIIPIAPNTSYYHYYRQNGLVLHPGGWLGEDIDFLYDFINSGDPEKRAYCAAQIRDGEYVRGRDRTTGDYNSFWEGRDYLPQVGKVHAAMLMAHAFNDWNVKPEHSVRIYEALKAKGVPVQAYYHQGGHGGAPPLEMMNKWFTRYLYGQQNGVEKDPRAWIVREGADRLAPTPYPDYPNPAAAPVTLRPQRGGSGVGVLAVATDGRAGGAAAQGSTTTGGRGGQAASVRETLIDDVAMSAGDLAAAAQSRNRLLYATPELTAPVHLSGAARVTLRLASSKQAANLSVYLVTLPWVGPTSGNPTTTNLITRGWADPQNHDSMTRGEPLAPGRFYDLSFALQPDDQIVPAGKRIALMIFSSDRDFTLWPVAGTELTIDLGGTSLILPVVGGAQALTQALGR
jgi:X-Pro dipeptidyl-peptidase